MVCKNSQPLAAPTAKRRSNVSEYMLNDRRARDADADAHSAVFPQRNPLVARSAGRSVPWSCQNGCGASKTVQAEVSLPRRLTTVQKPSYYACFNTHPRSASGTHSALFCGMGPQAVVSQPHMARLNVWDHRRWSPSRSIN